MGRGFDGRSLRRALALAGLVASGLVGLVHGEVSAAACPRIIGSPSPVGSDPTAAQLTRLTVRYATADASSDPARARGVFVRGSRPPLRWDRGEPLVQTSAGTFEACVWVTGPTEWKPLIGDGAWSRGPNYPLERGAPIDIAPRFFREAGRVERVWPRFASARLGRDRGIWVYVPPTYDENVAARFPVLYMHDGQNLFDDGSAFGGASWRVADAMNEGAARGTITEAIVVGVENTGARMEEYTPPSATHSAGRAHLYGEFLTDELKPAIDAAFRTRPEREWTGLAGSSLGGLVSLYVGLSRSDVFGRIAAFSPSTWWDGRFIVGFVRDSERRSLQPLRVYVDSGTPGDDDRNTRLLADTFRVIGFEQAGGNGPEVGAGQRARFRYVTERGGTHDERSWARRFPAAAAFLLGSRDGTYAQEIR